MIDELHVKDVALIRDATIRPSAGLTVLTGETGAGKSALLSSVKLLMGERADASAVREGSDGLEVEGRFYVRGGDPDGTVVRRRVSAEGHGRVWVDGRMASVRELSDGVGATVDLCGQHEHQRLLRPGSHVEFLDAWAGEAASQAKEAYDQALRQAKDARAELDRVTQMARTAGERVDEAAFVVRRIDEVAPKEGEYEQLEQTLPRAEHAEALIRASEEGHEMLSGDDGVCDQLSSLVSQLRDAARYDAQLAQHADVIQSSLIDLEDVSGELRDYRDQVEFDPEELNQLQSRMSQLQGLMRSYGPSMSDVLQRRDREAEVVAAAQDGDKLVHKAKVALQKAEDVLSRRADQLDQVRARAAPRLSKAITQQMANL
ncbi:MAG: AAA family ATPase, partial [Coriobacteriales bacterium]|nr:AAA family ATPase [Coriobacteriales bacterium]